MSRRRSLLGRLTGYMRQGGEVLATQGLRTLLDVHRPIRKRFEELLDEIGLDSHYRNVTFRAEHKVQGTGRIDLVAEADGGTLPLVLEAKFPSAPLRDNQVVKYADQVAAGGALLYVVPTARLEATISAVAEGLGLPRRAAIDNKSGLRVLRRAGKDAFGVAVITWRRLLSHLENQLDGAAAEDLRQLIGHCGDMEAVEYKRDELPPANDRKTALAMAQVLRLNTLIFERVRELYEFKDVYAAVDEPPNVGWYFEGPAWAGWFGFEPIAWAEHGRAPLWLVIPLEKWDHALTRRAQNLWESRRNDRNDPIELHYTTTHWGIPVPLHAAEDEEVVIQGALDVFAAVAAIYEAAGKEQSARAKAFDPCPT